MAASPFVLIIDDDDQEPTADLLDSLGVQAQYRHPQDITFADLERATLILVDEFLERWPEREQFQESPAFYVRDGIGLAALLRSHLDGRGSLAPADPSPSRTAIALRTGDLDRLASGIPQALRATAVAARHDLEWVFEKKVSAPDHYVTLATAVAQLPDVWDPRQPGEQTKWLRLESDRSWYHRAFAQIERCRPPWSELSRASAGRSWLSWFLQRVLPYSTFLVDDARAAALLGITVTAFAEVARGNSELAEHLAEIEYTGHLQDIDGRRWWRAGVQHLRETLLEIAGSDGVDGLAATASGLAGVQLDPLHIDDPVFVIDEQYRVSSQPISAQDAVRLQPDGWPIYADPAWLASEDATSDSPLRELVVLDDRGLLEDEQ